MRLIGYADGRSTMVARLADANSVRPIAPVEEFWADPSGWGEDAGGAPKPLAGLRILPPVRPSARVICVGLNYAEHADEGNWARPEHPTIFGRWTASLSTDGAAVAVPPAERGLDWEAELVAVVGRTLHQAEAVDGAVFGYAAFNDLTARRSQKLTTQWTLGKNADGSGPLGPIVTATEVGPIDAGLKIEARVNGETVQSDTTASMIFGIPHLLSFLSQGMTLRPGDLIATGTPSGVGYVRTPPRFLTAGDVVEVEIERVGTVSTRVV
ncbi:MAG TPA: fumarylacetoacetate hydrolase family protein [Pseudonocardiaceae bacterium]|nr:fumarylacetoacetate hydrolase family protein [Pseudonocardiaceae bacterium]